MGTGTRWIYLSALLALMGFPRPAFAQEIRTSSIVVDVPRLSQLDISGDVSNLLSLTPDAGGEATFDSGYTQSAADGTILTLSTNAAWDLSARLDGPWSCPGAYNKNENDLFIKITSALCGTARNGSSSFINLTQSDLLILAFNQAVSGCTVSLQTRTKLTWTQDIPGSYGIGITYTLVTHVP